MCYLKTKNIGLLVKKEAGEIEFRDDELGVTNYELRITNYELRVASCELRV